jgi:hypothetical protein
MILQFLPDLRPNPGTKLHSALFDSGLKLSRDNLPRRVGCVCTDRRATGFRGFCRRGRQGCLAAAGGPKLSREFAGLFVRPPSFESRCAQSTAA